MSPVTRETNSKRKSHRLDIPLLVQIGDNVFQVADWSMTGVGIVDLPAAHDEGAEIAARLILPVVGAALQLDVTLVIRNRRQEVAGCEFKELSNRNRRVLRHFVELAMEGRLDALEDLVADFTAPDIETPLETALALSEEEELSLLAKFRRRASLALILGVLFSLFLVFTIWYNIFFLFKTTGVVTGNFLDVSPTLAGTVKSISYHQGDNVHAGDILFELSSAALDSELRSRREQLDLVRDELAALPQPPANAGLTSALKEEMEWKKKEFDSAQTLYDKRVISIKDYEFVRNAWSRARINYYRQLEARGQDRFSQGGKRHELETKIQLLKTELADLQRKMELYRVRSPLTAKVYALGALPGSYVTPGTPVVVLLHDGRQTVVFKMPSDQAAKIVIGTPVRFFATATKKMYEGRIGAIGYKAVTPRTGVMQEVSLKETVVRVDLPHKIEGLPVNSRVRVWVRKAGTLADMLQNFLPGSASVSKGR